jgi:small-conductance mechanosensitive channel
VYLELRNGEDWDWTIYITNLSNNYLDLRFNATTESSEIHLERPGGSMLHPSGSTEGSDIYRGEICLKVDKVAEPHEQVKVTMIIGITDIHDKSTDIIEIVFLVKVSSIYDTSMFYNKFLGIFDNTLPAPLDSPWVPFVVTILFWIIVSEVACVVLAPRLARRLDKFTSDDDAKKFESIITKLIVIWVFLLSLNMGLQILGAHATLISWFSSASTIFYIVIFMVIIWKVYQVVMEGILMRLEDETDGNSTLDVTLMPLARMIGKIVLWIAGTSLILSTFGVDLQGILVSAGVISLGITLGAQNVLSQFFSGVVLLMTRPFKKGDFLKINDKVYIVKKVKIMFTEFLSWDKDQVITMPNNAVTAATIVNLTRDDEAYRLYVYFDVAYGVDLKKAEQVMLDVANKSPVVLHDDKHAAPNVRMTNFGDSGIELRLGVTVKDFNGNITAASSLRMEVYQAFVDNGIEVPYNRLEVTMLNDCFQGSRRPGDFVED